MLTDRKTRVIPSRCYRNGALSSFCRDDAWGWTLSWAKRFSFIVSLLPCWSAQRQRNLPDHVQEATQYACSCQGVQHAEAVVLQEAGDCERGEHDEVSLSRLVSLATTCSNLCKSPPRTPRWWPSCGPLRLHSSLFLSSCQA